MTLQVPNFTNRQIINGLHRECSVEDFIITQDNKYCFTIGQGGIDIPSGKRHLSSDCYICRHNLVTGEKIEKFHKGFYKITSIIFNIKETFIYTAGWDRCITIWDLDLNIIKQYELPEPDPEFYINDQQDLRVIDMKISMNGKKLYVSTNDKLLICYELDNCNNNFELKLQKYKISYDGIISNIIVTNDNTKIICIENKKDSSIITINANNGTVISRINRSKNTKIGNLIKSNLEDMIIFTDVNGKNNNNKLICLNINDSNYNISNNIRFILRDLHEEITDLCLSSDGKILFTIGIDGKLIIINTISGLQIGSENNLFGYNSEVNILEKVKLDSDNNRLYIMNSDYTFNTKEYNNLIKMNIEYKEDNIDEELDLSRINDKDILHKKCILCLMNDKDYVIKHLNEDTVHLAYCSECIPHVRAKKI